MGGQFSPHRLCPDRSAIHPRTGFLRAVGGLLKKAEEVMEILEAYDLTGSLRAAAKLAGCDHKTVAHWVHQRELAAAGGPVVERKRPAMDGVFMAKIDELVDRSHGRIRADAAHDKLVAMGYEGSDRTTRRWVADAKRQWRREHGRRTAVDPGAWSVDAVGLRRRATDQRSARGVVLRMTITTPAPPPLPDELERLCRRLRLPYLRKHAPK
jgi:hypothetical protein